MPSSRPYRIVPPILAGAVALSVLLAPSGPVRAQDSKPKRELSVLTYLPPEPVEPNVDATGNIVGPSRPKSLAELGAEYRDRCNLEPRISLVETADSSTLKAIIGKGWSESDLPFLPTQATAECDLALWRLASSDDYGDLLSFLDAAPHAPAWFLYRIYQELLPACLYQWSQRGSLGPEQWREVARRLIAGIGVAGDSLGGEMPYITMNHIHAELGGTVGGHVVSITVSHLGVFDKERATPLQESRAIIQSEIDGYRDSAAGKEMLLLAQAFLNSEKSVGQSPLMRSGPGDTRFEPEPEPFPPSRIAAIRLSHLLGALDSFARDCGVFPAALEEAVVNVRPQKYFDRHSILLDPMLDDKAPFHYETDEQTFLLRSTGARTLSDRITLTVRRRLPLWPEQAEAAKKRHADKAAREKKVAEGRAYPPQVAEEVRLRFVLLQTALKMYLEEHRDLYPERLQGFDTDRDIVERYNRQAREMGRPTPNVDGRRKYYEQKVREGKLPQSVLDDSERNLRRSLFLEIAEHHQLDYAKFAREAAEKGLPPAPEGHEWHYEVAPDRRNYLLALANALKTPREPDAWNYPVVSSTMQDGQEYPVNGDKGEEAVAKFREAARRASANSATKPGDSDPPATAPGVGESLDGVVCVVRVYPAGARDPASFDTRAVVIREGSLRFEPEQFDSSDILAIMGSDQLNERLAALLGMNVRVSSPVKEWQLPPVDRSPSPTAFVWADAIGEPLPSAGVTLDYFLLPGGSRPDWPRIHEMRCIRLGQSPQDAQGRPIAVDCVSSALEVAGCAISHPRYGTALLKGRPRHIDPDNLIRLPLVADDSSDRANALEGQVLARRGGPVAGAVVQCLELKTTKGDELLPVLGEALAGADGRFRLYPPSRKPGMARGPTGPPEAIPGLERDTALPPPASTYVILATAPAEMRLFPFIAERTAGKEAFITLRPADAFHEFRFDSRTGRIPQDDAMRDVKLEYIDKESGRRIPIEPGVIRVGGWVAYGAYEAVSNWKNGLEYYAPVEIREDSPLVIVFTSPAPNPPTVSYEPAVMGVPMADLLDQARKAAASSARESRSILSLPRFRKAPAGSTAPIEFDRSFHALVHEAELQSDPGRKQADFLLLAQGAQALAGNPVWEILCLDRAIEAEGAAEARKDCLLRKAEILRSGTLRRRVNGNGKDIDVPDGLKLLERMSQDSAYAPWRAEIGLVRGRLLEQTGRIDEAAREWNGVEADVGAPTSERVRAGVLLAQNAARRGDDSRSLAFIESAAARAITSADPTLILEVEAVRLPAWSAGGRGADVPRRAAELRRDFWRDGQPYEIQLACSRALWTTDYRPAALDRAEELILEFLDPPSRWDDLSQLARQFINDGDLDRAFELWKACVKQAGGAAGTPWDLRAGLIQAFRRAGRMEDSAAIIDELLESQDQSSDFDTLLNAAYILNSEGRPDLARPLFLKGFRLALQGCFESEWPEEKADLLLQVAVFGFYFDIPPATDFSWKEMTKLPKSTELERFHLDIRYLHAMSLLHGRQDEGIAELQAIKRDYLPCPRMAKVENQLAASLADRERARGALATAPWAQ